MRCAWLLILLAAGASACDAPGRPQAVAAGNPTSSPATPTDRLIPGTPPGDLGDWVGDIRKGIVTIPELIGTDLAAAQQKALDLYVTRQEYAEMYYGVDGRIRASDDLAAAIETAEGRFHELMKLLASESPPLDAVQSAVDALDHQQAIVTDLWKQTGTHLRLRSAE
jgi:hypothetical protein